MKDTQLNIECRDPSPLKQYQMPEDSVGPVTAIIHDFLQQGVLRKANSVVNNCVWPIKNSDNSYSLSVDFRTLNKYIPNNKPVISEYPDIMSHLDAKAKIFSVLEIANSHLSIPLVRSCQYKLAFTFQNEQYVFTRLPPGLDISDNIVHESIAKIVSKCSKPDCIFQHVDKFLVTAETEQEHLTLLFELLTLLQDAGLILNTKKVQLMKREVKFLAMHISHGKRQLLQEQVKAILAVPIPTSHKALHDFLSQVNICKDFIQGFAEKVRPLYCLLKNKSDICGQWDEIQLNAFETLKKDLQNAPTLGTIDVSSSTPFVLQTHVSSDVIFVTFYQLRDGNKRMLGYFSRLLAPMEKNFDSCVKQLLGVYYAVKVTENIVRSSKIILQTPDPSLKVLLEGKGSGGFHEKYSKWFKVFSSQQIEIELTQHNEQTFVCTDTSQEFSAKVFITENEEGYEPVFVNATEAHSGRHFSGYAIWYPKREYAIQQKLPKSYSAENAELEAIKTALIVNEEINKVPIVIYSDKSEVVQALTDLPLIRQKETVDPSNKELEKKLLKSILELGSKSKNYAIVKVPPHMKDNHELSIGCSMASILANESATKEHFDIKATPLVQKTSTHVSNFVDMSQSQFMKHGHEHTMT